jgi:hypothetical protein
MEMEREDPASKTMPQPDMAGSVQHYNRMIAGMDLERQSFIPHYKELAEFVSPRRGRFSIEDRNKGDKRHRAIINSAATQAVRVAVAGILNGTMSQSRPWFGLEPFDRGLLEQEDVREWLYSVELMLREILNASNFYTMAPVFLKELILFGTAVMTHVDDFENVARYYTHTAGSYWIAQNERLEIDTIAREFEWPVVQVVKAFGLEKVSTNVKKAYETGNLHGWVKIRHIIEPNPMFNPGSPLSLKKRFLSTYYEPGNEGEENNKFLSRGGFDDFPAYVARWDVTEGDIYGVDCPVMTALGDVKQLQIEEKRKAQAIDKMVSPPLMGPPSVKNTAVSSLHGGLTVYEGDDQKQALKPIYQVEPRIQELRLDMDAVERRIRNALFTDLFLAISNMEGIQPRNQLDLSQRNEERLIQLGPVLERIHGEFLSKNIDRIFNQAVKADILPPAPEALQGSPLKVRFISTLALAQRSAITQDIDRYTQFLGGLAQIGKEAALDKFDEDEAAEEYARSLGIPPKLIKSDEQVAAVREARAQQMAQEQQMMQAERASKMAADVGGIPTGEGSLGASIQDSVASYQEETE